MRLLFALAFVVAFNVIALEALCPEPPTPEPPTPEPPTPEPPTPEPPTPEPPTPEPPTPEPPTPVDPGCNIVVGSGRLLEDLASISGYIGPAEKQTGNPNSCCQQCKTYRPPRGEPDCSWWIKIPAIGSLDDCFFFSEQPTVVSGLGAGYAWGTSPSRGGSAR